MSKGTIYDITGLLLELFTRYEDAETDDEREEILTAITQADIDLSEKADGYARLMRNAQRESSIIEEEIKRLQEKKKSRDNMVDRLKRTILKTMQLTKTPTIDTSIGKWSIRKNPLSVNIVDAEKIPVEFRIPQPDKIDKDAIKKQFKETGEIIDGVEYIDNAQYVMFR